MIGIVKIITGWYLFFTDALSPRNNIYFVLNCFPTYVVESNMVADWITMCLSAAFTVCAAQL